MKRNIYVVTNRNGKYYRWPTNDEFNSKLQSFTQQVTSGGKLSDHFFSELIPRVYQKKNYFS
jgi:hypothetical protein